jgi:hypothetical protein
MASGNFSTVESSQDSFYAFYTDGILRDSIGEFILDENGDYIYDGWVTSIGPMSAQELTTPDTFNSYGGTNSGSFSAVESSVKDTFTCVGNVNLTSNFLAAVEGAKDFCYSTGRAYTSLSIFAALESSDICEILGSVTVNTGSLAATDSPDVFLSNEDTANTSGTLEVTETDLDVLEFTGTTYASSAILEVIESADVWESTGTVEITWIGTLDVNEISSDTFISSGTITINSGTLASVESLIDTYSSIGTVERISGILSALELQDTLSISGNISTDVNEGILTSYENISDLFTSPGTVTKVRASADNTTLPLNGIYSIKSLTTNQVKDVEEVVFLNRDNSILLQLLSNDLPVNLYSVKNISLISNVNNLEITSLLNPEMFDWAGGDGELILNLSNVVVTPDVYYFYLILYDDYFVNGLVWDTLSINFVKTFN